MPKTPELDHIGLYVNSLNAAAAQYERMGFTLTSVSQHSSQNLDSGEVTLSGVANRCAMLAKGYLELVCIVDPALDPRGVAAGLARYEGLHIVAMRTWQAEAACATLQAQGFDAALGDLRRTLDTPTGPQVARFTQVRTPPAALPEATVFMLRHETPELLWQPEQLTHPNGAQSLDEVWLCVPDAQLPAAAARYSRYLGAAAQPDTHGGVYFPLAHGVLRLLTPAGLAQVAPGASPPLPADVPWPAGYVVGVRDLAHTAAVLRTADVAFTDAPDRLTVLPAQAAGACLIFRASAAA